MITPKIIFNLLAFTLFIIIFFKMIKKNDTTYIDVLVLQFIGIGVNFIELISDIKLPIVIKILLYILCVIIPGIILVLEKKNILFPELLNVIIAKIYLKQNKPEEAKKYMLKLIDKYPNSYLGHKIIAEIYELDGKHTNAIDEYVRAIEINTKDYNSYYKISVLLQKLNNNDAAINMLNDLLKKKPDYLQATMLLGDILYDEERFKEATIVYTEALKYNPANYDIYYNLGMVYTRLNDFQKAKEYYQMAAEINSMLYNAKFSLAQISMLYGDMRRSRKLFYGMFISRRS
ncbi:MAG: tetratricopeptide repeat protein [Clostridia bacterium]|nr:tetratricopeptide repeat protein [Clostridia bacterium]